MYYIHPIPESNLEVLAVLEDDETWINETTRLSRVCKRDFEILKN